MPVLVLPLHGHLAPAAWAAAQAAPGLKVGYVQTGGGALPGSLSRDVAELRERGLLCGHITAAPAYGGEHEAISVAGALDAAAQRARLGRGDRRARARASSAPTPASATAASPPSTPPTPHSPSACRPCSPRASPAPTPASATAGQPPHPHRPADCSSAAVEIPVPVRRAGRRSRSWPPRRAGATACTKRQSTSPATQASGLPARTMGRTIEEDPLFFAARRAFAPRVRGGRTCAPARV